MPGTTPGAQTGAIDDNVLFVLKMADNAAQRGALAIWTIYDHPRDYPHGFVARKHEAIAGRNVTTDVMLIAELEELRRIFSDAGLVCVPRADIDDIKIVESWV
jgi:hypothetical protein